MVCCMVEACPALLGEEQEIEAGVYTGTGIETKRGSLQTRLAAPIRLLLPPLSMPSDPIPCSPSEQRGRVPSAHRRN